MANLMKPLAPDRRHPCDYRDDIEHAEVAQILAELPADHRACVAYASGAREAADSLSLTHLVADRPDLVARLIAAYEGHSGRIWKQHAGAAHLSGGVRKCE